METVQHHRNEDAIIRVTITNPDGTPYDLTGATLKLLVKTNATDADGSAVITKTITATPNADGTIVAPATAGIADFYILPANTATLGLVTATSSVTYFVGVKVKTSAAKLYTVVDARYELLQELIGTF